MSVNPVAKKKPLSMGTSFAGYRLDMEWLPSMAGVKFNDIPYKGTSQMLTDLVGNHLDLGFPEYASRARTALFVHADTPKGINRKLKQATRKAVASEPFQEYVKHAGADTLPPGAAEMRTFHAAEVARYPRVADPAGIKPA